MRLRYNRLHPEWIGQAPLEQTAARMYDRECRKKGKRNANIAESQVSVKTHYLTGLPIKPKTYTYHGDEQRKMERRKGGGVGEAAEDDEDDEEEDEEEEGEGRDEEDEEEGVSDIAAAMDEELDAGMKGGKKFDPVELDMDVVSNLLSSYEAQDGNAGPVSNMLRSMGINLPDNEDGFEPPPGAADGESAGEEGPMMELD